jgi:hypothetical protein
MILVAGCATSGKAKHASPGSARATRGSGPAVAEAPPAAPFDQQSIGWTTTPLPIASQSVAVKEGAVPLVYLVESPGVFRVHDQTAGQDLARTSAVGRSIVRVDARAGVVFGGETLYAGPLPKDHRYVIYRDPTGPNMARQGTFQVPPRRGAGGTQSHSISTHSGGHEPEGGTNVER